MGAVSVHGKDPARKSDTSLRLIHSVGTSCGDRTMALEVDHAFITCARNAPEADALLRLGFVEGSRNTHPGQGTANRRFFFDNFMLEFLWVVDPGEVTSERTRRTRLWERCSKQETGVSPIGIVFRPAGAGISAAPFRTWSYCPSYLPHGLSIEIAVGTTLAEPELFYLPFLRRGISTPTEPTDHALALRRVRSLSIGLPNTNSLTDASFAAEQARLVTYFQSPQHVLEIFFEGSGKTQVDLRPGLPLVLRDAP
jgi:Glyoxalase-like domain